MNGDILIVEDEAAIADVIAYALKTEGFTPHLCALGEEALARLRAGTFSLVILDVGLQDLSGFEVCRRLPIHPLQHLLVGLSLAIFFLLLLSLSEHVPFGWAYLASSLASLGLLGIYLVHVLRSARQGLGFTGGLALIFALLYGLLLYEDSALLMGSAVLFLGLAAVMIGTRKVDWYALGQSGGSAPMSGGGK